MLYGSLMSIEFPTRVSKIIHRHNKVVAELITKKLKSVNPNNQAELSQLVGWLNGVATVETKPDLKREIVNVRSKVQQYANQR